MRPILTACLAAVLATACARSEPAEPAEKP